MRTHGRKSIWAWLIPFATPLLLTSCLVVVSTSPTTVSGATIVFFAFDEQGAAVPSLHIRVADVRGSWRTDGLTRHDGSFHCGIGAGVARIRADIDLPAGYVLARPDPWPRHFDVAPGATLHVEIRVRTR